MLLTVEKKYQTNRKKNTSAADTAKMSAWHCASGLESAAFASAHSWSTCQLIIAGILKQRKPSKFHRKSSQVDGSYLGAIQSSNRTHSLRNSCSCILHGLFLVSSVNELRHPRSGFRLEATSFNMTSKSHLNSASYPRCKIVPSA